MSPHRDCSEDWIARAKRGVLTESQARELRDLLATSVEARLLYEAGSALDRDACVLAGDDARLENIAGRLQKRYEKRAHPLRLRGTRRGIAAALLVAGAAVGAVGISKKAQEAQQPAPASTHAATKRVATLSPRAPSEPTATNVTMTARGTVEPAPVSRQHASTDASVTQPLHAPVDIPTARPTFAFPASATAATGRFDDVVETHGEVHEPPAETTAAATLFAEANRARVQGNAVSAVHGYEQLLSRYPRSRESGAARLSLGMLYVQQGQPESALAHFRGYVASGGPLTAEALWGEARALHLLGRIPEEEATLQRIIRDYPSSPYAATAHSRLTP